MGASGVEAGPPGLRSGASDAPGDLPGPRRNGSPVGACRPHRSACPSPGARALVVVGSPWGTDPFAEASPLSLAPGGGPEARRAEWPSQSGFPGPKRGAVSFPVLCLRSASGAQGAPLTGSTRLALALLPSGSASAFAHVLGPLTLTAVADTSRRGLLRPWFGACSSAFARLSHSSFSFSACQAFFGLFGGCEDTRVRRLEQRAGGRELQRHVSPSLCLHASPTPRGRRIPGEQ